MPVKKKNDFTVSIHTKHNLEGNDTLYSWLLVEIDHNKRFLKIREQNDYMAKD